MWNRTFFNDYGWEFIFVRGLYLHRAGLFEVNRHLCEEGKVLGIRERTVSEGYVKLNM